MQALPQVPQPQAQGPSSSVLFSTANHQDQSTEPSRSESPAHTDLSSLVTSPPLPILPPITHITPTISLDISRHITANREEPEATPTTGSFATPIAETPLARPTLPGFPSESRSIRTLSSRDSTASTSPTSYRQTFQASSPAASRVGSAESPLSATQRVSQSSSPTSPAHSASPPLRPAFVPSLSQIYPQDLDAEHNVVLLSPPSSRSESPFSVVSATSEIHSPPTFSSAVRGASYRSPLIEQSVTGEENTEPRTPGSTATSYLSLTNSTPSSPISTPTSPFVPLSSSRHGQGGFGRRGGSDEEYGSEFDFDIISDTTSVSAFNSPTNPSSPFSMSPFASPRMGGPSAHHHSQSADHQHGEQPNRAQDTTRPTSPAVSTTSTMSLSELDMLEHDDAPWEDLNHTGPSQGTLRRFPGRGSSS